MRQPEDLKRKSESVKDRALHSCIILELPFETTPTVNGEAARISRRAGDTVALGATDDTYPASLRRCVARRIPSPCGSTA